MNRTWRVVGFCLIIAGTLALYAESSSTLTVSPRDMREGETRTITDDGTTITVTREGQAAHIRIDAADRTEKLTITREGGRIRIGRLDVDGARSLLIGPGRERIVIDGLGDLENLKRFRALPGRSMKTFFVCPNDQTTLHVPQDKADQTYRCPVDGAEMEKRRGHGFTLFLNDALSEL
jgi:hypothetical protein